MFAPPVAKPRSARPQRSAVTLQRRGLAAIAQGQLLQQTIGNRAPLPLSAQRATVTLNQPGIHDDENNAAQMPCREAPAGKLSQRGQTARSLRRACRGISARFRYFRPISQFDFKRQPSSNGRRFQSRRSMIRLSTKPIVSPII